VNKAPLTIIRKLIAEHRLRFRRLLRTLLLILPRRLGVPLRLKSRSETFFTADCFTTATHGALTLTATIAVTRLCASRAQTLNAVL
jgi:hypothetical protein